MEKCSRCMGAVKNGVCTDCSLPVKMAKSNEERLKTMFKANVADEEKSANIAAEKEATVKSAADDSIDKIKGYAHELLKIKLDYEDNAVIVRFTTASDIYEPSTFEEQYLKGCGLSWDKLANIEKRLEASRAGYEYGLWDGYAWLLKYGTFNELWDRVLKIQSDLGDYVEELEKHVNSIKGEISDLNVLSLEKVINLEKYAKGYGISVSFVECDPVKWSSAFDIVDTNEFEITVSCDWGETKTFKDRDNIFEYAANFDDIDVGGVTADAYNYVQELIAKKDPNFVPKAKTQGESDNSPEASFIARLLKSRPQEDN